MRSALACVAIAALGLGGCHAFTGLAGLLLVAFHSAFQLRTPIAVLTSASLGIVVVTGLVGFYLHALLPKPGSALKTRLTEIRPLLPGFVDRVEDFVKQAPLTTLPQDASYPRILLTIPRWVREARGRRRGMRKAAQADKLFRVLRRTEPALARALLVEFGDLAAKEVDSHAGAAIMRTWRSLHRFLAILLFASVSLHIGVAWCYGFRRPIDAVQGAHARTHVRAFETHGDPPERALDFPHESATTKLARGLR